MSATDYERTVVGLAFLNDHVDLLDGMDVVGISAGPHSVEFHVGTHDEARQLAADLSDAALLEWVTRTTDQHLNFEAEQAIGDFETRWERLTVRIVAIEDADEDPR